MAVIQYNNGFIDQLKPKSKIFSDLELIEVFKGSDRIRSRRLLEIPNSWCIWGEDDDEINENDYNALGSKIVEEEIFSNLLIIHDSEVSSEWNLTDKTIINTYNDFREITYDFIDAIAMEVIKEKMEDDIDYPDNESIEKNKSILPRLDMLGNTEDKKLLMEFKPSVQTDKFWEFSNFSNFAQRSFEYLHAFSDKNLGLKSNAFVIYADVKGIIIVKDSHVDEFMRKMLENFERREKYHGCSNIVAIGKKWKDYINGKKEPMKRKWSDYMVKNEKK